MRLNTSPRYAIQRTTHDGWNHASFDGEFGLRNLSGHIAGTEFANLRASQLSHPVVIGMCNPIFAVSVQHVVDGSAEPQMVWPYTGWYIASMTDMLTGWYRSVGESPGCAGGKQTASIMSARIYESISSSVDGASPQPTVAGLINLFPKAVHQGTSCRFRQSNQGFRSASITTEPAFPDHHLRGPSTKWLGAVFALAFNPATRRGLLWHTH